MKFLLSWLKEFIELSVPPETLAQRLTLAGLEVTALTRLDKDWLFEAEVTPNRPDLLSHLGIARETAAVLRRPFRFPRWLQREFRPLPTGGEPFPVSVEDPEGCPLYVGLVIEGVRVGPSVSDVVERLNRLSIRPVNNIVDITHLCMLELGQPLHAFDLSWLEGNGLVVRRARAGEKLETIDGVVRELKPDLLVIADQQKPVALAGIMGGRPSEIRSQTKTVFLESAWFRPALIRRATRSARLSSDSSYRFERGVNPEGVASAALRAARWMIRSAGGNIRGPLTEVRHAEPSARTIVLKPKKTEAVLGMKSSPAQQRKLLGYLGCQVQGSARSWKVTPPAWRSDLRIPEDLHEEIARLIGYDRCPVTLPSFPRRRLDPEGDALQDDPALLNEMQVRSCLAEAGGQEILTYSLLSAEQISRCGVKPQLLLRNPLSSEQACLRPTLLAGALEVLSLNLRRRSESSFLLFELGTIYGKQADRMERRVLSLLAAGTPDPQWAQRRPPLGLFQLKGSVEFLFVRMGWTQLSSEKGQSPDGWSQAPALEFRWKGKRIGSAGNLRPEVLSSFEIPEELPVAYAELELEALLEEPPKTIRILALPKCMPVHRDLALVVPESIPYEQIHRAVTEAGKPLLQEAKLFDLYRGKQVPPGKKSLALRLSFADPARTLTEEEVQAGVQAILQTLKQKHQITLR